jgi:Protein of unknown function (DUF3145)
VTVRGMLHVLSAPLPLCEHVEWVVSGIVQQPVTMSWTRQPACPGTMRSDFGFRARPGTAAAITSALAAWRQLRFEASECRSPGCDGARYSYTPSLGTFAAVIAANGDIVIPEGRLRSAMTAAATSGSRLEDELTLLLGQDWDAELEPFRQGLSDPVRRLTVV